MGLHEELTADSPTSGCKVCTFLANMDTDVEGLKEWDTELALPVTIISHKAVVKALQKRGVEVTEASVRRHRSNHVAA